jgi:hypothetical protein
MIWRYHLTPWLCEENNGCEIMKRNRRLSRMMNKGFVFEGIVKLFITVFALKFRPISEPLNSMWIMPVNQGDINRCQRFVMLLSQNWHRWCWEVYVLMVLPLS